MNEDEIKNIVIEGYRNILKREPDPSGLENYIQEIKNGLNIERFHEILRTSDEYKYRFDIKEIEKFNKLVSDNKASGKPWYYGLEDTWWWGRTEEEIREIYRMVANMTYSHPNAAIAIPHLHPRIISRLRQQQPIQNNETQEYIDKIVLVSTWDIKCGIAMYTKDLLDELEKLSPGSFTVRGIESSDNIRAKLIHLQHEFSIVPRPPIVGGKVIVTWHTIPKDISDTLRMYESMLDIAAYIVPCEGAIEFMNTSKDVHVIKLGSMIMPVMKKEDARAVLNINIDKPIGFVFGFQSANKNYSRLINAAKNTNVHLIISGSTHFAGFRTSISNYQNITFLDRHLTEEEVNLYSLASDLLLFDYIPQDHYSASSALHRTVGAGRPVICANTKHFNDIDGVPKFNDQQELEQAIRFALDNQEDLGRLSLRYAIETRREEMARRHIDIYKRYINF